MTNLDRPIYRVESPVAFVLGSMYSRGDLVTLDAWPRGGEFEPQNATAKAIAKYYARFQAMPGFPASPYSSKLGRHYLPGHLPRMAPSSQSAKPGSEILGLLPSTHIDPDLPPPRYRMKRAHLVGSRELAAGEEFFFIGYPALEIMEPVDDQARAITAYLVANEDNSHMLACPWCCLYGPTLPQLEPPPRKPQLLSGVIGSWRERAEHQRAVEAEIAIATGRQMGEVTPIKSFPSKVTNSAKKAPPFKPAPARTSR